MRVKVYEGWACLSMCPRIQTEGRKSLRLKEAPVEIEPTNRGFAVDRELLRWTLSRSIPLHKAHRFSVGLRLIVFR